MKKLNENVSRNIMKTLKESESLSNQVKQKILNWSKDKNLQCIGFICDFTAWFSDKEENESNEELIDRFYREYGNRINIVSKVTFNENDENLKVDFKFSANRGGQDYKASGTISARTTLN